MTLTAAITAGSLSGYASELLRRLGQGWPLTLAEYVRLEESLAVAPSGGVAGVRQTRRIPRYTSLIGQPPQQTSVGPLWSA